MQRETKKISTNNEAPDSTASEGRWRLKSASLLGLGLVAASGLPSLAGAETMLGRDAYIVQYSPSGSNIISGTLSDNDQLTPGASYEYKTNVVPYQPLVISDPATGEFTYDPAKLRTPIAGAPNHPNTQPDPEDIKVRNKTYWPNISVTETVPDGSTSLRSPQLQIIYNPEHVYAKDDAYAAPQSSYLVIDPTLNDDLSGPGLNTPFVDTMSLATYSGFLLQSVVSPVPGSTFFVYVPGANFTGTERVPYYLSNAAATPDGVLSNTAAMITFNVSASTPATPAPPPMPVPSAPTPAPAPSTDPNGYQAINDAYTVYPGQALELPVLDNDVLAPDWSEWSGLNYDGAVPPQHTSGLYLLRDAKKFIYIGNARGYGKGDQFGYIVYQSYKDPKDPNNTINLSTQAKVFIEVLSRLEPDTLNAVQGVPASGNVSSNDHLERMIKGVYKVKTGPQRGEVKMETDGRYTYTAWVPTKSASTTRAAGDAGTDQFTYVLEEYDRAGTLLATYDEVTVNIALEAAPPAPPPAPEPPPPPPPAPEPPPAPQPPGPPPGPQPGANVEAVPSLDGAGLLGLSGLLAMVAGYASRRKRKDQKS